MFLCVYVLPYLQYSGFRCILISRYIKAEILNKVVSFFLNAFCTLDWLNLQRCDSFNVFPVRAVSRWRQFDLSQLTFYTIEVNNGWLCIASLPLLRLSWYITIFINVLFFFSSIRKTSFALNSSSSVTVSSTVGGICVGSFCTNNIKEKNIWKCWWLSSLSYESISAGSAVHRQIKLQRYPTWS